ncbi:MotA/TolQ/ExbB proton channel family protein [Halopseudomonas pachastrellae]|nr:MotA/TolQ/ExbB proton channel family protein [Halopseudomonas pachastrellae]
MAAAVDNAETARTLAETLQDWLVVGGPVVWILLGMSVVALTILLIKLWQFYVPAPEGSRAVRRSLALWHQGHTDDAIAQLNTRQTVPSILLLAMRGKRSGTDQALLREELERVATFRLNQLKMLLRPLEVIANLAPLLGLLGTVLGMIVAFQNMEAAGSRVDPSVLSGGIWQALLTTAVGLAVAIPTVAVHSWLERRVERVAAAINDAVTQVFTHQPKSQSNASGRWPMQLEAFPGKKRRGISLTPLIDVVFILLLFFMLSSNFMHWRQISLSSANQTENTPDEILWCA